MSQPEKLTKAALAQHLTTWHAQPEGRQMCSALPVSELKRWRMDELVKAHEEMHFPERKE